MSRKVDVAGFALGPASLLVGALVILFFVGWVAGTIFFPSALMAVFVATIFVVRGVIEVRRAYPDRRP